MSLTSRWTCHALIAASLLIIPACSSSSSESNWNFTIDNQTATDYAVFLNTAADNVGFRPAGVVDASGVHTIKDLAASVQYTFRLSPVGMDANAFVYEHQVSSSGSDMTWTVP
jgi:hypothetical protein